MLRVRCVLACAVLVACRGCTNLLVPKGAADVGTYVSYAADGKTWESCVWVYVPCAWRMRWNCDRACHTRLCIRSDPETVWYGDLSHWPAGDWDPRTDLRPVYSCM